MALFGLSPLFLSFVASSCFNGGADGTLNVVSFLAFLAISSGVVHIIGAVNLRVPNAHLPPILPARDEEADETTTLLPDRENSPRGSLLDLLRDPYFWILFMLLVVILGPVSAFRMLNYSMNNVG